MTRTGQARLSLRTLSVVSVIVFALLIAGLVWGLASSLVLLQRAMATLERDTQAIGLTRDLELVLREYHLLGNLWLATNTPEFAVSQEQKEAEVQTLLSSLEAYVHDSHEMLLFAQMSTTLHTYLHESATLKSQNRSFEDLFAQSWPRFAAVLARIGALREHFEESRRQANLEREMATRWENLAAILALGVLFIGLIAVALGVQLLVLLPVQKLQLAMQRFRSGDPQAKAPENFPREMHELAAAFNEMADSLNHQRRDQLAFLGGVAHDLRDPLSALTLAFHVIERHPTAATPEAFNRLHRQLDRLRRMINDLLDATRIEAGELELHLEPFDLTDATQDMVELYARTSTAHEVIFRPAAKPVMTHGDRLRIEQVISNLLSNAIKYSPRGGLVQVTVGEAAEHAVLTVADQGMGIPADEIPDIFMPFRRRLVSGEVIPGAGLGLSIVKRIVDAHHGSMAVDSTLEKGSTFRVRLPLAEKRR